MKLITALVLAISALPALASYSFQVGEEIKIQDTIWRRLSDNSGSSCQLQYLSTLTVEKVSAESITVRYHSDRLGHPSNCQDNTVLLFEPHFLDSHRDAFYKYQNKKIALDKIKKGLSIESMGSMSKGDQFYLSAWRWAVVEETIGHFREGDLCRVWDPGYLRVEGFYEGEKSALFIYQNSANAYSECPEGTLFFETIL